MDSLLSVVLVFFCSIVKWEREQQVCTARVGRSGFWGEQSIFWASHLHSQVDVVEKPCWGLKPSCSSPETGIISLALFAFLLCFAVIWKRRHHHERSIEKEVRRAGGWQYLLLLFLLLPSLLLSILRMGVRWGELPWRPQAQLCLNTKLHPWVHLSAPFLGSGMLLAAWWWIIAMQRLPWSTSLQVEAATVPAPCPYTKASCFYNQPASLG